jgi:branched-chain amino acid transport system substrate-binding protein
MENDSFAQDVRAGVLNDIERHGMQVVIDDQLPPELNDMSMTLGKIKALKPDVLVVSGHEKGALTAVTQIDALKVYVPITAMTNCGADRRKARAGSQEAYAYNASYQAAESAAAAHSLDPDKIRDAIAAMELDTSYGPAKFSPSGRNIAKPMVLTQVPHGKCVMVALAKWTSEKPVIPRPHY